MDPSSRAGVVERLAAAGCVAPTAEADELIATAPDVSVIDEWVARRSDGEPLAWITGSVVFCGHRLHTAPDVYVPRPQSEELARRATGALPPGGRALDLCTGIGAVAAVLRAHDPAALIVGTDVDRRAAACAVRNGVPAIVGDLAGSIAGDGTWDVVTAVAPYVPTGDLGFLPADVLRHEPPVALDGGPDGLDLVRRVLDAARRLLRTGGCVLVEIGGAQDELLRAHGGGFAAHEVWHDEDGDVRGAVLRRT